MAFNILPIEINEKVATYLSHDQDLCHFTLICRRTHQAVQHFRSGVWRHFFTTLYDVPARRTGHQLKQQYQVRQRSLRFGPETSGKEHLEALRDLILESFSATVVKPAEKPYSKNLEQLRSYIRRSNVLRCVLRTRGRGSHGLLQTIQLLLLPWSLEFAPECPTLGFTKSQQVVYSHPERYPLFMDKYKTLVNITFLLHISNFFKYHMTQPQEATLFNPFHDLEDEEKPKMWQSHLEQGTSKLGKSWKGSYAYLHDLREVPIMRSFDRGEHVIIDTIDHSEDGFQTLEFDFTPENCPPWPAVFDEHLNSFPSPALLRKLSKYTTETEQRPESGYLSPPPTPGSESREDAQCAYFPFSGAGIDADPYICSGIIHALPPQHGIPGWQRITMMKMFGLNSSGITSSQQAINPFASSSSSNNTHGLSGGFSTNVIPALIDESCWAYEGVVLPGGMIMLGRWWSPADETVDRLGTGPFIFWNVDDQ